MDARVIVGWLRSKLGDDSPGSPKEFWQENPFGYGDTESGFDSTYTIDYDAVEKAMDEWIKTEFKQEA